MVATASTSPWIFPNEAPSHQAQPVPPSIVTYSGLSDTSQYGQQPGQQPGQHPNLQQPPSVQHPIPTPSNINLSYTEIGEQCKEYKKWSEAQIVELTTQVSCARLAHTELMETLKQLQFDKLLRKLDETGLTGLLRLKNPLPEPPRPTDEKELFRLYWDKEHHYPKGNGQNRFLVDAHGQRIQDEAHLADIREHSRQCFIDAARLVGMPLDDPAPQWGDAGAAFQSHYRAAIEEAFPFLRLCSHHWKANSLAKETYPGWAHPALSKKNVLNGIKIDDSDSAPLKFTEVDQDSPEVVDHKVRGLLNKLSMEKFDSISDQIIEWANKSEKEKDGRTLIQVIRLVFEKATDEVAWSGVCARLCHKMMEQISNKVQDDGIRNPEGKPIAGGQLFRKYLLNRCREDFERGWVAKEATAAAAASKALEDEAAKASNEKDKEGGGTGEVTLYSEEYHAIQKARRQGLGLIKFIGELFKLQMLGERIMHECVKKLLINMNIPEEEEIESLCNLLTTVGSLLDTQKAHAHMDVYFQRMRELTRSLNVSPRMQIMLQDVIELRDRKWVIRNAVAAPATIAQIHEAAAKEKASHKKEYSQRQISMSLRGSRRGGDRSEQPQVNPERWAVAGDLSNFGRISKTAPTMFGSSVSVGKKADKRESLSRTSLSSNMFSMLQNAKSGATKTPDAQPQRRRLALQPRTVSLKQAETQQQPESSEDEEASTSAAPTEMSEEAAKKKIDEDSKEFFRVRNLDEAEVYFTALPAQYHHRLIDKLVFTAAVESKEADAQLVSDLFNRAASKNLCAPTAFEEGLMCVAEVIGAIAIDAPKAFTLFATMVKGVGFDEDRRSRLASKSMDGDKLLALLS